MKSRRVLLIFLFIMAAMIITAILFYSEITDFLYRPSLYPHLLFIHVLTVTLFFANAVVGMLWELRSLATRNRKIIMHTYNTVTWLDARFSSPLIIISVTAGIFLSILIGDIWDIGWLFASFILFLLSGFLWVIIDIPTQYKIKTMMNDEDRSSHEISDELLKLLKKRLWISLSGVTPLVVVFILMIYKPEMNWITL